MRKLLLAFLMLIPSVAWSQTNAGPFYIGTGVPGHTGNDGASTLAMDSSADKVAFIVSIPRTGTISKIGLWMATTTTGDTLSVALKTVGTDGLPTSTNYGGSTPGTVVVAGSDDNKAIECTLGTAASGATAGDLVAVVITFNSYVAGNLQVGIMGGVQPTVGPPYVMYDSGGTYANQDRTPCVYLYYSCDSSYRIPLGCYPPGTTDFYDITQNSTPDEVGIRFVSPANMRLCGAAFSVRKFGTTAEINVDVLSNAATPASLLANRTVFTHSTIQSINHLSHIGLEPESLTTGQVVVVSIFSEDTSNSVWVRYFKVDNASHWGDFAQGLSLVTRTRTDNTPGGGPGWTEVTTRRLMGGLWFDQITAGSNTVDPLTGTIPGL